MLTCYKMTNMSHFGTQLADAIEASGVSRQDFAFDLRVDPAFLSKVINGKMKPSKSFLDKLIEYGFEESTLYSWLARDDYPAEVINIASADTLTIDFIKEELLPRLSKEDKAELLKGLKKQ